MKKFNVLGLMSGTSLDGLDLAYCQFWQKKDMWNYKINNTKSVTYSSAFKDKLKNAISLPASELLELNSTYGAWLGEQSKLFIDEGQLTVDIIASHGHTTHHQPNKGFTYQIGSGQHIANYTNCKTICDFRSNDVALGGQGAPLVPIGDKHLFGTYDFCLNLGGISNVSFQQNNNRIAYDIGIANMALNYMTQKIDLAYDHNGDLAKKGELNQHLLDQLNALEYYKLPFPKSTGYEWFLKEIVPLLEATNDALENILHTLGIHICDKISENLLSLKDKAKNTLLITGGGAFNAFLITTLQEKLGPTFSIAPASSTLIEFKEALIFAFMGVLRNIGQNNVLSSVTGATKDSCSGVIYVPQ
ncbi:anhydro-N-acetylmuramic acid kinase [Cellulophaga sp. F20128]|uniref:anhydro-N-acetylmuramic acid kinase n=1 Tax=Cellulophaga sp. F20128 TaxID=2926413 RepID=UPI001FF423C0|nr:anhydro-N-acetylmuramic acid kinase [Cellulophaga sp. F20128]MCK0157595.1 anhydro-N-acetylmuramic acid kinase [Cellulophaga sp. F20128]